MTSKYRIDMAPLQSSHVPVNAHIPKSNSQETFNLTKIYNNLNTVRAPTCYLPFHETFQPQRVHLILKFRRMTPPSILAHAHLVRNDRLT